MKSTRNSRDQNNNKTVAQAGRQRTASSTSTSAPTDGGELSTIDRAVALRDSLRSITGEVGELVKTLKRERKQHRAVRSTLLSLRQLQAVDA